MRRLILIETFFAAYKIFRQFSNFAKEILVIIGDRFLGFWCHLRWCFLSSIANLANFRVVKGH